MKAKNVNKSGFAVIERKFPPSQLLARRSFAGILKSPAEKSADKFKDGFKPALPLPAAGHWRD
jgi:hypothetical protein